MLTARLFPDNRAVSNKIERTARASYPSNHRLASMDQRSRPASCTDFCTGGIRYSRTVRVPRWISAVTCIPGISVYSPAADGQIRRLQRDQRAISRPGRRARAASGALASFGSAASGLTRVTEPATMPYS